MYKAVLIDLDDTILDFKKAERIALKMVCDAYKIPWNNTNISLYSKINQSYWKALERKEVNHEEVIFNRWVDFFSSMNITCNPKEINGIYFKELKKGAYFIQNAQELLMKCSSILPIYLISNGDKDIQYPRIEASGIKKYIQGIYLSMEIGYNKPDPRFFSYVLKDIGLESNDCIVLGDSLTSDILGAINSHIDYVWFNPNHIENKEVKNQIFDLLEFFAFLE